jgi:hypothetical protein
VQEAREQLKGWRSHPQSRRTAPGASKESTNAFSGGRICRRLGAGRNIAQKHAAEFGTAVGSA